MISLRSVGARIRSEERGFTIVESLVALVIIFGLMITLLRAFDISVGLVSQTNRSGNANALASELIERARSLEWDHMGITASTNGSSCPDDVGCATHPSSITSQITTNLNGNYAVDAEEIVFANGPTFDPFLSFSESVDRDDVTYDRYLFVTSVRDDPLDPATEQVRRITAIVRWDAPNGHTREIRLVTFVADFIEPSQPFILGEVSLDGGSISIRGNDGRCGFDPECGAFVQGTSDFAGGTPREDFEADLYFADLSMIATTNYVSGASYRGGGSSGDVRWAGSDGLVTTTDDTVTQFLSVERVAFVDDDASSSPPFNEPRTFPVSLSPGLGISLGAPLDAVVADLLRSGDLNLSSSPDQDVATVNGEAWTEHDTDPGPAVSDGLPYVASELDSPETTRIGFREYADAGVRSFYEL